MQIAIVQRITVDNQNDYNTLKDYVEQNKGSVNISYEDENFTIIFTLDSEWDI